MAKKSIVVSLLLLLSTAAVAQAQEYDGIWFLGFNLKKAPFNEIKARQAVAHAVEMKTYASYVPPEMPGFDPKLKSYKLNVKYARKLMGALKSDHEISLLHTDGVKTVEIAQKIRDDLSRIGLKINLIEVAFRDQARWTRELSSGKHELFLMGYKAEIENVFTDEAKSRGADGVALLKPLFHSEGDANFSGYNSPKVDALFDRLAVKEINRALYKDLPALVLFYIEKI